MMKNVQLTSFQTLMPFDHSRLVSASESLLSAAAVGHSWEEALEALARATHSHSACIWASREGRAAYLGNRTFLEEGAARINRPGDPPYTDEVLISSTKVDGFVTLTTRTKSRIERVPFYQDVMTRIGFVNYAGYGLDPEDGLRLKVALWRSHSEGVFDEDQLAAMNAIRTNIRFAILFARQKHSALALRSAAPFVARGEATFFLDGKGRVAPASEDAERVLSDLPFTLTRGRFVAGLDNDRRRLDGVIGRAIGPESQPGSAVLTSPAGDRYQLLVLPLHGEALDVFGDTRAIATVIRIGGRQTGPVDGRICRILQSGFDLTDREAEVATLAAGGTAPVAISRQLGISEGTVRNYIKAIFLKIGVRSQVELAALVSRYH